MKNLFGICAIVGLSACGGLPPEVANGIVAARQFIAPDQSAIGTPLRFAQLTQNNAPAIISGIVSTGVLTPLRLDAMRDGLTTWITPDGASITMDQGILRSTRGLGWDMLGSDIAGIQSAVIGGRNDQAQRVVSSLDGADQVTLTTYACAVSNEGAATILVDEVRFETRVMREYCRGDVAEFTNVYWLDRSTNRIVQSLQHVSPEVGAITIAHTVRQ